MNLSHELLSLARFVAGSIGFCGDGGEFEFISLLSSPSFLLLLILQFRCTAKLLSVIVNSLVVECLLFTRVDVITVGV